MTGIHFRHFANKQARSAPVVLIHGLFGSLENLGGLSRPLSEDFDLYAIDLPNHSRSMHTDTTSLSRMAKEVITWLDHQQLDQVILVGHSLGGKVAMEIALTQPGRVSALVVMDIAPVRYSPHHNQVFAGLAALNPAEIQSRGDADAQLQPYVPELPVRSFLLKNLEKAGNGYRWRFNFPVIRRDYPELINANSEGAYDGPVLLLKAGNSDYIQTAHREQVMSRFPQVQLKVVDNTGHWLHAEKPAVVAKLIRNFLSG